MKAKNLILSFLFAVLFAALSLFASTYVAAAETGGVSWSVDQTPALLGNPITYTLTITNDGNKPVKVSATGYVELSFASVSSNVTSSTVILDQFKVSWLWSNLDNLAPGAVAIIRSVSYPVPWSRPVSASFNVSSTAVVTSEVQMPPAPVITSVSNPVLVKGQQIVIHGQNFGPERPGIVVYVHDTILGYPAGNLAVDYGDWSDTTITGTFNMQTDSSYNHWVLKVGYHLYQEFMVSDPYSVTVRQPPVITVTGLLTDVAVGQPFTFTVMADWGDRLNIFLPDLLNSNVQAFDVAGGQNCSYSGPGTFEWRCPTGTPVTFSLWFTTLPQTVKINLSVRDNQYSRVLTRKNLVVNVDSSIDNKCPGAGLYGEEIMYYGMAFIDGQLAPSGTIIKALGSTNIVVGCSVIEVAGYMPIMNIYTDVQIPGVSYGQELHFTVDSRPARVQPSPIIITGPVMQQITLTVPASTSVYIPLIVN